MSETAGKKRKVSLTMRIFIALVLGVVVGIAMQGVSDVAESYIKPFGTIFLNLIKMVVVPVVLLSIMQGIISLQDVKKVGSIGIKTVVYYMCTTAFAVTLGLLLANLLNVGAGYNLGTEELVYEAAEAPSFMDTLVNIFPSNAIQPLASATMLQVIVIALFFGFGIIVAGEKGKVAKDVIDSFSEVSFKVMEMIIKLSPIGVFALICPVVASNGPAVLLPLLKVIGVAYLTYVVHMVVVYSSTVKVIAGMSPVTFFKGMSQAMIFAFSSASSVGALPFNLECTQKLGARKEVASFVLPLGATINMDGTAIYQGVCAIFIAQIFGFDLTISQQITIILTATLASIGTAGVPGSGMIMLAMVLESVGLPLEGIALVAGIDRILDMGRTCVNITGDAACTICVDSMEKKKEARRA
ncbi:dicarboxylate/amino acid:cation symporter [Ruminococcus sp. 5_1_39BFAA]|uniref:dicarboxylate/amino acid:cation symporter n=1 Tax=Ruminococcus sp. 5_1_39BFAA TaxID=457412 RepID=UPI00356501B8